MRGKPRRLARALLKAAAPSRWERCTCHGALAMLLTRSLEGFAPLRIESFPPSPFLKWVRRAPAEDGFGGFKPSHVRPGQRQAGAKRRNGDGEVQK